MQRPERSGQRGQLRAVLEIIERGQEQQEAARQPRGRLSLRMQRAAPCAAAPISAAREAERAAAAGRAGACVRIGHMERGKHSARLSTSAGRAILASYAFCRQKSKIRGNAPGPFDGKSFPGCNTGSVLTSNA